MMPHEKFLEVTAFEPGDANNLKQKYNPVILIGNDLNDSYHHSGRKHDIPCKGKQRRQPGLNTRTSIRCKKCSYHCIAAIRTSSHHEDCHNLYQVHENQPPGSSNAVVQKKHNEDAKL